MTEKELRRLSRTDLLSMLLTLSKENEELRVQLDQARRELESRSILIEESGSLAEAALRLNGVFEAAQAACDQYVENRKRICAQLERDTTLKCAEMIEQAKQQIKDTPQDEVQD